MGTRTCKLCNADFPVTAVIDGMTRDLRSRHYCLACSPYGAMNRKQLAKSQAINGIDHKKCPTCELFKPKIEFSRYREYYCGSCRTCRRTQKQDRKVRAVTYKGGKCFDCGSVFPACAYDFHHRNPAKKDFCIASKTDASWKKITKELDKCDLLCAVCHRIRHSQS